MGDRCTGHCCQKFYLPFSPAELARAEEARVSGADRWTDDAGKEHGLLWQSEIIAPMVVHLGLAVAVGVNSAAPGAVGHHYTCKYLAPDGNCSIYDTRPEMCRDYPYGRRCTFSACTWDAARNPPPKLELVSNG